MTEPTIDLKTAFNVVAQTESWKVLRGVCPGCARALQMTVPAEVQGIGAECEKCGGRTLLTEGRADE